MNGITYGKSLTSFEGPEAVAVFRANAISAGLRLYAKTKMLPNRNWTPKAMMDNAAKITGQQFKARDYMGASEALRQWALDAAGKLTITQQ